MQAPGHCCWGIQPTHKQPIAIRQARQQHRTRCRAAAAPALLYDFHDQLIPYDQAWSWQKQRVAELCAAAADADCDTRDTVFLLQHPPVYTLGAGSSEEHVKFDLQQPPHPLYRTERGGEVTYHGPGQLVMYPILNLHRHTRDLHWYLRSLEEVVIRALDNTSGLQGGRVPGMTGVWVDGHKLTAIGVRARKWVTYHGLALNVSADLGPFSMITPCGISEKPVGSVKMALGLEQQPSSAGSSVQQLSLDAVVQDPLITEYRYALLEALEEVFGLQLQPASQQQLQQLLTQGREGDDGAAAAMELAAAHS